MLACINISKPKFKISSAKLATRKLSLIWLCKMANSVIGKQGELLEYQHLIANPRTRATWTHSDGNKLSRLAQGMPGQVTGPDTIFFIPKDTVPQARAKDVMYGLITCLIRPEKTDEPNRTRLVAGGGQGTLPFQRRHTNRQLPYHQATHQQHDLHTQGKILDNGHPEFLPMYSHDEVLVHAIKTLRHAGQRHCTLPPVRHCNTRWVRLLWNPPRHVWAPASGNHCTGTIGKKTEGTRLHPEQNNALALDTWVAPNPCFLVADKFGVKYIWEGHAQHLLQTVQKYYRCLFEKEGERYCGLNIKWDYVGKKVHLSMPSYVEKALKCFQHP